MAEETPMEQQVKDDISEIDPFDLLNKKKKKKKKKIPDDSLDKLAEQITRSLSISDGVERDIFGFRKNKNNPAEPDILCDDHADPGHSVLGEDEEEGELGVSRYPLEGTDGDYGYEKLLGRVFSILRENNPKLAGDRCRTVLRLPEVLQDGTKKTVFVNFMDLCKTMHRHPEHLMTFLLTEMGTSGSLDAQERLVVKGRFASKNVEVILRRYINEYVICNTCKSPDTILTQEDRLFFLGCEQCGSERSVAPIMAGFVARVERGKIWT